ncbi:hypothetical protein JCM30237_12290 [Halolamina litorea]|uniref:Uncharacterized protein n=1 Tax=Halolamina litorea TaxID=1515593 RepID=A0ABD6BLK2_9EURY|nr:hypothetical protein [Halolamina litorea]
MSFTVEFGTKSGADAAREEHEEYVCPVDDDRRLKTVAFIDDTPEVVRDQLEAGAQTGRAERDQGSGQADLTDAEKNRVGPFVEENNYLKAASVKALLRDNGVSDWEAWYDPELSVDEHKSSILPEAQQAGGGDRIENDGPDRAAAARAEKAAGSQCDHAQDHCKHGDSGACEFLRESCGMDDDEVSALLSDEPTAADDEITGDAAGALGRAWQGYKAGISRLDQELSDAVEAKGNAEQAAAAINAIRADHGQEPMEFKRLEELSDELQATGRDAHDARGHVEEASA